MKLPLKKPLTFCDESLRVSFFLFDISSPFPRTMVIKRRALEERVEKDEVLLSFPLSLSFFHRGKKFGGDASNAR